MVTFVFTDIEGSTLRWDRDRSAMHTALRMHDATMRAAIAAHAGHVFKTVGDAFCVAFSLPEDAIRAMVDAQRALVATDFAAVDGIRGCGWQSTRARLMSARATTSARR
jgi:class 3 adenylate cyclase